MAARRPAQLAPLPIQRCSKTSTRPRGSPRDEEGAHGAGERRKNQGDEDAEQLAEKGVLAWVGKGTNDPYQYYRLNESAHDSQLTARGRAVGCYGPDSCNRPLRHARSHREMHSARPEISPPTPRAPIRGRRIDQLAPADHNGTDKKPAGFARRSRESGSAQFFSCARRTYSPNAARI